MNKIITDETVEKFQESVFSWWKENRRDFPWRKTTNPYEIMVSEFMLQQTQTSRVIGTFKEFLNIWPGLSALAEEEPSTVIKFWSEHKLGYNRRAKWLHEAAIELNSLDSFPLTPKELRKLKGIGSYASRSILIFAFNQNLATIDTNIRSIYISEGFATEEMKDSELLSIAERFLPIGRSRDWHNALMDYGAVFKTARKTGIKPRTRQSTFKNSTRAYRGSIIKLLSTNEFLTLDKISEELGISKKRTFTIISSLTKDGLVKKENDYYSL